MEGLEIRQMQTFKTIVEVGNFTKAAEQLQYAQSTITAHIQGIEEELGGPLFNRVGKKIVLTEMSRELYTYVVDILNTYSKIKNIAVDSGEVRGNLRIGASETLTIYKLGPVLSEFREKYPRVNISLINDNCIKLRERLYTGDLDLAIVLQPEVKDDNLTTVKLNEEEMVFVGPCGCTVKFTDNIFKENALKETLIFTEKDCSLRKYFEEYLKAQKVLISNKLELSNIEAIKQCVVSGLGISLLPYISVKKLIDEKKVIKIENDEKVEFLAQLAYLREKKLTLVEKKFIEVLEKYVG